MTDQMTGLTDDYLFDVLTRLDHEDLDKVAVTNRGLCVISKRARSIAIKLQIKCLTIYSRDAYTFTLTIYQESRLTNERRINPQNSDHGDCQICKNTPITQTTPMLQFASCIKS
ncbi:hypothetical protein PENTCL1PPCAC_21304 [Pristionchus entomophagus]|uniref:F-box domain-containing protein n=1 Tax=Pristionchus entomophagus TaxID=358040 RepID=A0AAV5TYT0_9BILA|nr:hypothetical protein PENTCL1PPCAC_21304 [Pristionchus entomophagus]